MAGPEVPATDIVWTTLARLAYPLFSAGKSAEAIGEKSPLAERFGTFGERLSSECVFVFRFSVVPGMPGPSAASQMDEARAEAPPGWLQVADGGLVVVVHECLHVHLQVVLVPGRVRA